MIVLHIVSGPGVGAEVAHNTNTDKYHVRYFDTNAEMQLPVVAIFNTEEAALADANKFVNG